MGNTISLLGLLKEKNANQFNAKTVSAAFLGDSVTFGCFESVVKNGRDIDTVYDTASSYPYKLKKIIETVYPSLSFNVINSGISGDTAEGGLKRLERDIMPFNPDLVVVGYLLNDCGGGKQNIGRYTAALEGIFKRLKGLGKDVIFLTTNMMCSYVREDITEECVRDLAKDFSHIQNSGVLDFYADAGIETALKCGALVCDCYTKWKKMAESGVDTTQLLCNKLNHPARDMHWLFAYSLFETIMFENGV